VNVVEETLGKLKEAIVNMDAEAARTIANETMQKGVPVIEAVKKGLCEAMFMIGEKFQSGEIFMPEMAASAEAFYSAYDVLKPEFVKAIGKDDFLGTMVIGTIAGDIHSVGKDLFIPVAMSGGINSIDLGIDVPPERFVEAVKKHNAEIVGVGTYMSETFFHTPDVVGALKREGLRDKVKIICGGPSVDANQARKFGADDASDDAWEGVEKIKALIDELRSQKR